MQEVRPDVVDDILNHVFALAWVLLRNVTRALKLFVQLLMRPNATLWYGAQQRRGWDTLAVAPLALLFSLLLVPVHLSLALVLIFLRRERRALSEEERLAVAPLVGDDISVNRLPSWCGALVGKRSFSIDRNVFEPPGAPPLSAAGVRRQAVRILQAERLGQAAAWGAFLAFCAFDVCATRSVAAAMRRNPLEEEAAAVEREDDLRSLTDRVYS